MAIIQKYSFPQNLEAYNTFLEDTTEFSRYFKVTQLRDTFTSGKNAFLIQGAPELKDGSYLMIEVKDSNGRVIYNEPAGGSPSDYYEGVAKPIAVYVYSDTAFGPATITILGELTEYEIDGIKRPIPDEWKGRPNVKWQKKVNVYPILANTTPIRFYRRPKVEITEISLPIFIRTSDTNTTSSVVRGVSVVPGTGTPTPYNGQTTYQIRSTNPFFTTEMVGYTIDFTNILDVNTSTLANPNKFSTKIKSVLNTNTAEIENPYIQNVTRTYELGKFTKGEASSTTQQTVTIISNEISNFAAATASITYETAIQLRNSQISSSYAQIEIKDLETFSGDVYRLKLFANSKNDLRGYQLLEDIIIESPELLQVKSFLDKINVRIGVFTEDILNQFWSGSSTITYRIGSNPVNSVIISNSIGSINPNSKFICKQQMEFKKDTEYSFEFKPEFSGSSNNTIGKLNVFLSGSAFNNTEDDIKFGKKLYDLSINEPRKVYDTQRLNFKPDFDGVGNLVFNTYRGANWILSDISIKPSKESGYSPNQLSFLTNPNIQVPSESFDFRFELYDINYNYVPVKLETSAQFIGGNDILPPSLTVVPTVRRFTVNSSGTDATPQSIDINWSTTAIINPTVIFYNIPGTDALVGAKDINNNPIDTSEAVGNDSNNYPGRLTGVVTSTNSGKVTLTFTNFQGFLNTIKKIGSVTYKIECYENGNLAVPAQYLTITANWAGVTAPPPVYSCEIIGLNATFVN